MAPGRIEVHQFAPTVFRRDAVGNHTLATRRALRRAGMAGQTWAEQFDPRLALSVHRLNRHRSLRANGARRILLYQASTGSEGMVSWLAGQEGPLALYYHNITPAEFFSPYDGIAAASMRRGRRELAQLARRTRLAFAASEYSATELRELGLGEVRVLPPYYSQDLGPPHPAYLRDLRASKRGTDLLFVGKLVPHKGQLDLIRMAGVLRANTWRPVRLYLVGGEGPHTYVSAMRRLVDRLGLQRTVFITGSLSPARLAAHYQAADVFVCLSEHEGFGIPVLEAMRSGLPVVARDAGAIAEVMAGTGVLLGTDDPLVTAEVVSRVAASEDLRGELVGRQRERAREVDAMDRDGVLLSALRELADG